MTTDDACDTVDAAIAITASCVFLHFCYKAYLKLNVTPLLDRLRDITAETQEELDIARRTNNDRQVINLQQQQDSGAFNAQVDSDIESNEYYLELRDLRRRAFSNEMN